MNTMCETAPSFSCFNREGLAGILPHKGAALRKIDGVFFELNSPESMTGFKSIADNDPDLDGHFPGAPTYPGYAQDEFACLTAAALILFKIDGLSGNPFVVQKVVKYRKAVSPGDTLTARVTLTGKRKRFFIFSAEIKNQYNEIVAEYERIVGAL